MGSDIFLFIIHALCAFLSYRNVRLLTDLNDRRPTSWIIMTILWTFIAVTDAIDIVKYFV